MEKFSFQAVNPDGKRVSGTILAPDANEARSKLKQKGFAVLSIEEYDVLSSDTSEQQVFEFKVKNAEGQEQRGTIEAEDEYAAYKKLSLDFDFEVLWLVPNHLPEEQKVSLRSAGIKPEFTERLKEDKDREPQKEDRKSRAKKKDEAYKSVLDRNQRQLEAIQNQIEGIIQEVSELLQNNAAILDPVKKLDIEKRLNLLSRIKQSNSADHLRNVVDRLLDELGNDKLFLEDAQLTPEQRQQIEDNKGKFKKMVTRLDKKFAKSLSSISFSVDTKEIQKKFYTLFEEKLGLVNQFHGLFYWTCGFLFTLCGLFWVMTAIRFGLSTDKTVATFYLHSSTLWFLTALSGLLFLTFSFPVFFPTFWSKCRKSVFLGAVLALLSVLVLEFPVIFYWT